MKRFLFFSFLTLLFLSTDSNASTATYSDDCATLSLTGPGTDPGSPYYIEASGKNNSGNTYITWFYSDGNYIGSSQSFTSPSFATSYGPFTGPHIFKLTIQGGGDAHGYCKRSVELAVKKDLKKMATDICAATNALSDGAFKNNPSQRKNAFCNKTDEVIRLIESAEGSTDPTAKKQYYQEAINVLQNDIGAKMDGYSGGDSKDDWITDKDAQASVYPKVQQLVGELVNLL